jgi:type IV secretion system protein VirB10
MNDGPDNLHGERSVSAVASTATPWLTPRRKALVIGVGTAALLGFIYWKNPGQKKDEPAPAPPATGISQVVSYEAPKPVPLPAPTPPAPAVQAYTPPPQPAALPEPKVPSVPANDRDKPRSRMLSFATTEQKNDRANGGGGGTGGEREGTQVRFKPTEIPGAKAGAAIDKTLVLMPGLIRCVLDVEVNSQLSGPLMCHLPDPVISDGNVTLMEKGSQIFGSYTSEVKQGQNRIMAVSATGWTPNGVPIPLGGPLADSLGATGMPGSVDNHYGERFGAATALMLINGGLGIAQAALSKEGSGGNSYISLNSGNGVGSLAQEVLRSTINIPPTIQKHQGDEVYIWVLQPIDFSAAYKLVNR